MGMKKIASLEIFSDKVYINPVITFLDSIISHTNVGVEKYNIFRFFVSELLRIRIKNAFPDSIGIINVEFSETNTMLEVSIRDKGVPVEKDFSKIKEIIAINKEGIVRYMIDSCINSGGIENLGKEGQRIFVKLRIESPIKFKKTKRYKKIEVLDKNIKIHPVVTENDVIEAIRCIYSEYGYSYSYEQFYYVDSFMEMIKNKRLISFLAVNEHGQVAGHFALTFSELYKNMPEISTVIVKKEFRGLGLSSMFINYCVEFAKKLKVRALLGQPVAYHTMTQKVFNKAGFVATSLLASYVAADIESEYNKNKERLDLCACVKIIDKEASSKIYPPKEINTFLKKIYNKIGWKYEFCTDYKMGKYTSINREDNNFLKMTRIFLREASKDLEKVLRNCIMQAIHSKNEMIEIVILLNSPSCDYSYTVAKKCDFVLSGIIPGGENGDYLIMQMLLGDRIDYTKLVTENDFEELKNDIINITNYVYRKE